MPEGQTPQHWVGDVKPRVYRRESKSAVEKELIIGRRGNYFSVIRARLLEPTPEYPNVVVAISLGNGDRSAFAQVKPQEFNDLVEALQGWRAIFMEYLPGLEQKSAVYTQARADQDARLNAIRQLMGDMTDEEGGMDVAKIMKIANAMAAVKPQPEVPNAGV